MVSNPRGMRFMNMFITELEHAINVKNYCDVHVRKMITEQAQMLSTAHRILDGVKGTLVVYSKAKKQYIIKPYNFVLRHLGEDGTTPALYLKTHENHPNNLWIRESVLNYRYAYHLFIALLDEYEYRFGKRHESAKLKHDLKQVPRNLKKVPMTPFVWDKKYHYINNVTDAYKKAFVDKYREWSLSNAMLINGDANPVRKRLVDISWTKRDIPEFIDNETLDMIFSYHAKAAMRC